MSHSPGVESGDALSILRHGFDVLANDYKRVALLCQQLERQLRETRQLIPAPNPNGSISHRDSNIANGEISSDEAFDGFDSFWSKNVPDLSVENLATVRKAIRLSSHMPTDSSDNVSRPAIKLRSGSPSVRSLAALPSIVESSLEQDFTTRGKPSSLACPFDANADMNDASSAHVASVRARYRHAGSITSRMSAVRIDGRNSAAAQSVVSTKTDDANDICGAMEQPKKLAESVRTSAGVCPIRFLKVNTAEEVAAYFQDHKHELPRSHQECVQRYQGDEKSVQELDAKYSNLVSMIKGLGEKHVSMLPGRISGDMVDEANDTATDERIRDWTEAVGHTTTDTAQAVNDTERVQRFDRPMQDVRVGESPSRPWGIRVPIQPETVMLQAADPPIEPKVAAPVTESRCPMSMLHQKGSMPHDAAHAQVQTKTQGQPIIVSTTAGDNAVHSLDKLLPGSTFTGPMFFGYNVDEAIRLIKAMKNE